MKKYLIGGGVILFLILVGFSFDQSQNISQSPTVISTATTTASTTFAIPEVTTKTAESVSKIIPTKISSSTTGYKYYPVSSVVDGDTLKINMDSKVETLRLIGLDTPETVDPRKPVQCFGREASNKAKELLSGKKVRVEIDPSQGERDKYNRLLAYIYREDGLFYNKYMIEQGYAHEYTYNTPYKYQTEFKEAERKARLSQVGLWSPDSCSGNTTSAVTPTTSATQTTGKFYTSSYSGAKYYYPESCDGWKSLSTTNLKVFSSLTDLLASYPSRVKSSQCQ